MECLVCQTIKRDWVCVPCVTSEVGRRRTIQSRAFELKQSAEAEFLRLSQPILQHHQWEDERERRKWRIQKMKEDIEHEQQQIQKVHARISAVRQFRTDHSNQVSQSYALLQQFVSDFEVTGEEMKQIQLQLATNNTTDEHASSSSSNSVASLKRRLQMNPLFTHNLEKFRHQLTSKLSKYQLRLVEQLLQLYVIKRRSQNSCTIVGLEVFDDAEVMFLGAMRQNQAQAVSHVNVNAEGGMPNLYHGPPGSDPEVIAAALGYLVFILNQLSSYLQVRLPYVSVFHGSHSYVIFHDEDETRYYLTLLDNTNPNHFRRAITLVNHNIQYFFERMMKASIGAVSNSAAPNANPFASLQLVPLALLPNMLKLIELIGLHLKQQGDGPLKREEEERREQQAREILEAKRRAEGMKSASTTTQKVASSSSFSNVPPLHTAPHASPTPPSTHHHSQQSHTFFHPPPDRTASPMQAYDHSTHPMAMSQSIVTIRREDAMPGYGYPTVRSIPPGGQNNPAFQRMDSPPFYSDPDSRKGGPHINPAASYIGPMDSPQANGAFSHQLNGLPSPSMRLGDPALRNHPPASPASANSDRSRSGSNARASPSNHPLMAHSMMRSHMDGGDGESIFSRSGTGYISAEEPRESVLLYAPSGAAAAATHNQAATPGPSPYMRSTSHGSNPSPAPSPGPTIHPSYAATPSPKSTPTRPSAPPTPTTAASLMSQLPTGASLGLAALAPHLQQAMAVAMQISPFKIGGHQAGDLEANNAQSHRALVNNRPAVSYASEAEADWDLVDQIAQEPIDQ